MSLKGRMRRLERLAEGDVVSIPQRGGRAARFPASDLEAAFVNLAKRMGAGEDAPPEHPLLKAARNSDDPEWSQSIFVADPDEWVRPVEDLSEQGADAVPDFLHQVEQTPMFAAALAGRAVLTRAFGFDIDQGEIVAT